jgi:hypothetical protein
MTQHYPQPPHTQMQPPKKKHTARNVILIILGVCVLGIGGCVAFIGTAANEVGKSIDVAAKKNAPRDVKAGAAFELGKHQTLAGWTVKNDGGMFAVAGKAKNTSDGTSTAFLHFKFLTAAGEVLGNVQCNSSDLEPGQTEALNCIPDGKFGKYAKITAEATF